MDNAESQIVESIKSKGNILITVSTNPSVDELSAALGLTIMLNNMEKRATAVVSGSIPPAINFLEPDKTFENSAESLRDFIIALDKEKADHLRYKVEGDVVKIFITPYKTTLSQADLDFSQGDYNVELVIGLGVKDPEHLDKALEAHGKILHDAKVVTITAGADASKLGSIDWHDAKASSICEMIVGLADQLRGNESLLDQQISTALLTGIVSATDRFSNDHTSPGVMTIAAQLMAAGANQQLIAAKLEDAHDIAPGPVSVNPLTNNENSGSGDGTELVIERDESKPEPQVAEQEPAEQEIKVETVVEPPQEQSPQPATAVEDVDQLELEKQLAGVTNPTGTMADIEKELQQAAVQPEGVSAPLAELQDTSMPGFEPIEALKTEVQQIADSLPAPEPESPPLPPPEIINEHGPISSAAPEDTPQINSVQDGVDEEATIDPFDVPATAHEGITVVPGGAPEGTPEGAAILSMPLPAPEPEPETLPATTPEPTAQQAEPSIPELPALPPLPPLPADENATPLPPPPPPPPVFNAGDGTMPSGAVSGDVFGDSAPAAPASPETPPTPPEPGQFQIPGQHS